VRAASARSPAVAHVGHCLPPVAGGGEERPGTVTGTGHSGEGTTAHGTIGMLLR